MDNVAFVTAVVAALSAALSPIITAVINNIYQAKQQKRDLYIRRSIEVVDTYLSLAGKFIYGTWSDFAEYESLIFVYVPEEYWNDIDELNNELSRVRSSFKGRLDESALATLNRTSKRLSAYTDKLRK